jgi:hypothetical protein
MMNFWLLLAVVVACAIVWAAHRYLSRSATIWLGVVFVAVSGMALLLDVFNDGIRGIDFAQQSDTGQALFSLGPEVSLLGGGWNFFLIGLLCGLALIVVGLRKQSARHDADDDLPIGHPMHIEQELEGELAELANNWNPQKLGQQDAAQSTGPIPSAHETKPTGNERNIRDCYMNLAEDLLRRTVRALQKQIADAVDKLSHIVDSVETTSYQQIAQNDYNQNKPRETNVQIKQLHAEITNAHTARARFCERLNLQPEDAEWANGNTSLMELCLWGGFFGLAEFIANYWLLKAEIGAQQAVNIAFVTVVIILVFAFLFACVCQFARQGRVNSFSSLCKRVVGVGGAVLSIVLFLCALGTLLGWRDVTATDLVDAQGPLAIVQVGVTAIVSGYASVLSSPANFAVFSINLLGFGVFAWKSIFWTDKYHGYGKRKERAENAQEEWDALLAAHDDSVSDAVEKASEQATDNTEQATAAILTIREKRSLLENIPQVIGRIYTAKLHPSYSDDIRIYRQANAENRALNANPVPKFWDKPPELCDVKAHFTAEIGLREFLKSNQAVFANVESCMQSIRQADEYWHKHGVEFGAEWSKEFEARIDALKKIDGEQ